MRVNPQQLGRYGMRVNPRQLGKYGMRVNPQQLGRYGMRVNPRQLGRYGMRVNPRQLGKYGMRVNPQQLGRYGMRVNPQQLGRYGMRVNPQQLERYGMRVNPQQLERWSSPAIREVWNVGQSSTVDFGTCAKLSLPQPHPQPHPQWLGRCGVKAIASAYCPAREAVAVQWRGGRGAYQHWVLPQPPDCLRLAPHTAVVPMPLCMSVVV